MEALELWSQSIIDAAKEGLQPGPLSSWMSHKPFTDVQDLLQKMEEYARAEDDDMRIANKERAREKADRSTKDRWEKGCEKDERYR